MDSKILMHYAYPIQFAPSVHDAVANLVRLISTGACGYDRGTEYYLSEIKAVLSSDKALPDQPVPGFPFAGREFREILHDVASRLEEMETRGQSGRSRPSTAAEP